MINATPLGMKWTRWDAGMQARVGRTQAGEIRRVRILSVDERGRPTSWWHLITMHVQSLSQSSAWSIRAELDTEDGPSVAALAEQVREIVAKVSGSEADAIKAAASYDNRWEGWASVKAIMEAWRDYATAYALPGRVGFAQRVELLLVAARACDVWVNEGHVVDAPSAPGAGACPHDTDGDGNCGQPACPVCGRFGAGRDS